MICGLFEYFLKTYINDKIFLNFTLRAFFSLLTSLLISLCVGPYLIFLLKKLKINQVIRSNGPISHIIKQDTPTMGGVIVLFSIVLSILLWVDLHNHYIWYVVFILIFYGLIGFIDDYLKIFKKDSCGLSMLLKYCLLSAIAALLMIMIFIVEKDVLGIQLIIPCCDKVVLQLGVWYILFGYLVIVGTSNAVNLSDGLDGLAIMLVVCVAAGLGIIALVGSNVYFARYFHIQYFVDFKELVVICSIIVGSGLGFLWFNTYPAQVFMGDIGSLSLGGAIGVIAILLRQEIVLFVMGGVFVLEAFSVIIQVCFFKVYGYRIFRMAPIHHHFELLGLSEPCIVVRLWIVSLILVLSVLVVLRVC